MGIEKIRDGLKISTDHQAILYKIELRQGGVYALPDGTELVAGVGRAGHYFFYHPRAWKEGVWIVNLPIAYEVGTGGQLVTGCGQTTPWRIEDLRDSGHTIKRD